MSYAISVPTPFNDISELAESFYSRVDEERLMLPNPEQIPEGEVIDFNVTLADGSAALVGQGRCSTSIDNGEERAAEHRFDVVIEALQLDEMAQIYFERILQVRATYAGDEPHTGEVEVPGEGYDAGAYEEQPAAEVYAEEPAAEVYADEYAAEPAAEAYAEPAAEDYAEAEAYAEPAAEAYAEPAAETYEPAAEAYAEPAAEAYAEPAAEAYAEPAAEAYAEPAVEAYAEPAAETYAEAGPDEGGYAEVPAESFAAEAAYEEPAPEVGAEAFVAEAAEAESNWDGDSAVELDSIEEIRSVEQPVLETPAESKIYALPDPVAPGALPSPHAVAEVLTRPFLHATWSPEPQARLDPSPATGYFQYAMGAGLPQPAEPPRPALDPSLRVVRAPRPGDPHAAPAFEAAPAYEQPEEAGYAEQVAEPAYAEGGYEEGAYAEEAPAEAYAEEAPAEAYAEAPVEGYVEAEGYAEAPAEGYAEEAGEAYAEADEAYAEAPAEGYVEGAEVYAEEAPVEGYAEEGYAEAPVEEAEQAGEEYAADGEVYAVDDGFAAEGDGATLDAEHLDGYDLGEANQDETRQVDLSAVPDDGSGADLDDDYADVNAQLDQNLGDETMQVELPEGD